MKPRLIGVTVALALLAPAYQAHPTRAVDRLPALMLWAWERPVDLRGLPAGTGVAFLAQTITTAREAHVISPRRQPLHVDPGTALMAVTRIEAPGDAPSSAGAVEEIARAIAATATLPQVDGVQIDFDARVSQRAMYRQLLHAVRRLLPPETPLSMTALASWCLDDDWLDDLPIDEVVPMLFRMGPSESAHRNTADGRLHAAACRNAVGVSLDEPLTTRGGRRRLYVFNAHPWDDATLAAARKQVSR
jgi:hypothetical protein